MYRERKGGWDAAIKDYEVSEGKAEPVFQVLGKDGLKMQ